MSTYIEFIEEELRREINEKFAYTPLNEHTFELIKDHIHTYMAKFSNDKFKVNCELDESTGNLYISVEDDDSISFAIDELED